MIAFFLFGDKKLGGLNCIARRIKIEERYSKKHTGDLPPMKEKHSPGYSQVFCYGNHKRPLPRPLS